MGGGVEGPPDSTVSGAGRAGGMRGAPPEVPQSLLALGGLKGRASGRRRPESRTPAAAAAVTGSGTGGRRSHLSHPTWALPAAGVEVVSGPQSLRSNGWPQPLSVASAFAVGRPPRPWQSPQSLQTFKTFTVASVSSEPEPPRPSQSPRSFRGLGRFGRLSPQSPRRLAFSVASASAFSAARVASEPPRSLQPRQSVASELQSPQAAPPPGPQRAAPGSPVQPSPAQPRRARNLLSSPAVHSQPREQQQR